LLLVAYLAGSLIIGAEVRSVSSLALRQYAGGPAGDGPDRVVALVAFLESDRNGFRDRNLAVWALGQLGDPRALPVLRKYYTGEPRRENLDRELSQHELRKAIRACQGGTNIGAWIWRHGELARRS
jgi:hypothetical protein